MRPSDPSTPAELYECRTCGARPSQPETRICEACGGILQHLGRARDL